MADTIRARFREGENHGPYDVGFFEQFGTMGWQDDEPNKTAAHQFRVELISRIATVRLAYGSGIERAALESVVDLFKRARTITADNPGCGTFEILTWFVLNNCVRPFTAKWHPLSQSGRLDALDASDEFRAELYEVQSSLRFLERKLAVLLGSETLFSQERAPFLPADDGRNANEARWRPAGQQSDTEGDAGRIEREAVQLRRVEYQVEREDWASGLALSGGGIRSATFSLGVLAALAHRNLLPQFDYLSTVSGGGYAGGFLTSLMAAENASNDIGLKREQLPFKAHERESDLLMGVRQRASYLSAVAAERLILAMRAAHGIFVNILLVAAAMAVLSFVDYGSRQLFAGVASWVGWVFPVAALLLLNFARTKERLQFSQLTGWQIFLGILFCVPLIWLLLGCLHSATTEILSQISVAPNSANLSGLLLVGAVAAATLGAICAAFSKLRSPVLAVSVVVFMLLLEQAFYQTFEARGFGVAIVVLATLALAVAVLWAIVDVNKTSLHRYYRSKLATAFIYPTDGAPPKMSTLATKKGMYPIVNCALNLPGSQAPRMRGRLADVFSITPHLSGSNVLGYQPTEDWERSNSNLDLATAMAISGAAASPQMGLRTSRYGSFWLTLFNVRLGVWLGKPSPNAKSPWPRLPYLAKEFMATTDENLPNVHLSDGGHIENLGVYELLRRRCRYIVAIDGENDPRMTFHALTNLQRLAYIDMGIQIDANLDDLRLLTSGYSRSHFRFCRIEYPNRDNPKQPEIGYLLYIKLSLTGNESEFLRRYRLDEPAFPHHTTADQFFTETQFEAYRALGEHIGDKLFMKAIVEELSDQSDIKLEKWMGKYRDGFIG